MYHLYKLNAVHRDLKLANVFMHYPGMEGKEDQITNEWLKTVDLLKEPFYVKIGDFGFSKIMDNINNPSSTYCGTPINMAPEMLNKLEYTYKADVWSVGTMLFELLTGYSPFKEARNKEQLKQIIR